MQGGVPGLTPAGTEIWWNGPPHEGADRTGTIATVATLVGATLLFFPGAQVVGGGLIAAGGMLSLTDSIPAFAEDPNFGTALAVAADVASVGSGGMSAVKFTRVPELMKQAAKTGLTASGAPTFMLNAAASGKILRYSETGINAAMVADRAAAGDLGTGWDAMSLALRLAGARSGAPDAAKFARAGLDVAQITPLGGIHPPADEIDPETGKGGPP